MLASQLMKLHFSDKKKKKEKGRDKKRPGSRPGDGLTSFFLFGQAPAPSASPFS